MEMKFSTSVFTWLSLYLNLIKHSCATGSNETVLFVYGTLKRGQPNHRYLADHKTGYSRFVSEAKTEEKWPLVIASKYNIPFILNAKGIGKQIYGEIYYVDEKKLKMMDEFEGYPQYYDRLKIEVELYSFHCDLVRLRKMSAWAYMLNNFDQKLLKYDKYEKYDSYGEHELYYVPPCERSDDQSYSPMEDVKKKDSSTSKKKRLAAASATPTSFQLFQQQCSLLLTLFLQLVATLAP